MGHANTAPEIPEVVDEAGDSPKWLPLLGLALALLAVGGIVWSHGATEDAAAEHAGE